MLYQSEFFSKMPDEVKNNLKTTVLYMLLCASSAIIASAVLAIATLYLCNVAGVGQDGFDERLANCSKKNSIGPEICRQFENRISVGSLGIILGSLQLIASIIHVILKNKKILFSMTHLFFSGIGIAAIMINTDISGRSRTWNSPDIDNQWLIDATFAAVGTDTLFSFSTALVLAIVITMKY